MQDIPYYVLSALAVLITLTVHEYAHAWAAYKLGDPTAKNLGRLSLNPIKHLDPVGALCMLVFHFGWAKPVPITPRNFKNPRRGFAISALAGPTINLVISFFSAFVYLLLLSVFNSAFSKAGIPSPLMFSFAENIILFFYLLHIINLGIAIFNLLPVPPLDGSRILGLLLPPKQYFSIMRHERTIYYIMLGWLLVGDVLSGMILSLPGASGNVVLRLFANVMSLSNLLGLAIDKISGLITNFWQLFI